MRTPTRRESIFGVIFLITLAWGLWNYRHLFMSQAQTVTASSEVATAAATAEPPSPTPVTPALATSGAGWGGDPFNRPWRAARAVATQSSPAPRKGGLKLSAIVVRPDKRYAIINGNIVRVGDSIAGRRVTRIESSHVVLDDQGVEVTLTL